MTISSNRWADTTQTAEFIGIHPETLKRLRRVPNSPFQEGRDYRWLGLGKKKIQWDLTATDKSLWAYKREPAEEVETFSREPVVANR